MAEKMAVGPLDKRRLTKRCQSCAALRIKVRSPFSSLFSLVSSPLSPGIELLNGSWQLAIH